MFFGLCNHTTHETKTMQWIDSKLGTLIIAESVLLATTVALTIIGAVFLSGNSYFGLTNLELALRSKILFLTASSCFLALCVFETAVTGTHFYEMNKKGPDADKSFATTKKV